MGTDAVTTTTAIAAALTLILWGLALESLIGTLKGPGLIRRGKRAVATAVWAALGSLLGALLVFSLTFRAFSNETLVAYVTTMHRAPDAFELFYKPVGEEPGLRVALQGDQWSVSGGIVKWHPWLTVLGLKSYHREMRVSGQFSRLEQQRAHPPTIYPLQHPLIDRFWEVLYWADPALPLVEAVYGSAAYAYVEPGVIQELLVTPSGYMIKRSRLKDIP